MTPTELKSARAQIGLTQSGLAAALRMSGSNGARTVRKWEAGKHPIPGPVEVAMEYLVMLNAADVPNQPR